MKVVEAILKYIRETNSNEIYLKYLTVFNFSKKNKISMDTENLEIGDIFFAINRGNDYIEKALEKGASFVICNKKQEKDSEKVLVVDNSINTMQEIAKIYRKLCNFKIIAITGSNGKTSTKDILYSILKEKFKVEKTHGNFNNQIGVPYTILNTDEEIEYIVLEMGMSEIGQIRRLCEITNPNYGIITNIGLSHLEFLKTRENVFRAKKELLEFLNKENIFVNSDDDYLREVSGNKIGFLPINNSQKGCKNYQITDFENRLNGSTFKLNKEKIQTNLHGNYNAINVSLAIGVAYEIGLTNEEIKKNLMHIDVTGMRFEKINWSGIEVINDAYNASPISTKLSLETFSDIYKNKEKIVILGDMFELGNQEVKYHKEIIEKSITLGIKTIYLIGEIMEKSFKEYTQEKEIPDNIKLEIIKDKEIIRDKLKKIENKENKAVLLKGSRGMKLEEILN